MLLLCLFLSLLLFLGCLSDLGRRLLFRVLELVGGSLSGALFGLV